MPPIHRIRRGALAATVTLGLALAGPLAATDAARASARADLTVTSTTAPAKASTGKAFSVSTKVRNAGLGKSAATDVRYYLSKDTKKDRGDRSLAGSARLKALIGGTSWDVSARIKVPSGTVPGRYYVLACVEKDAGPAGNDCKAPKNKTNVTALSGDGSISGELILSDSGGSTSENGTVVWDRTSTVGIRIDVEGDSYDADFIDDGSTYTYTGQENRDGFGQCPSFWDQEETGQGGFVWTGDPFTDEIFGHFGHVDRSEVHIGMFINYDTGVVYGNCNGQTSQDTESTNIVSIDFEEVSRTSGSITYKAVDWEAEMGTTSNWDTIEGTITFALDQG